MAEQADWHVRCEQGRYRRAPLEAEPSWLEGLIDRFEMVSGCDQGAAPCEPAMIAACQRYLARSAADMVAGPSTLLH